MKINAFSTLLFILLLTFQNVFSQNIQNSSNSDLLVGHVYAHESNLPIDKATIKIVSKDGIKYFITDVNGKFEIPTTNKKESILLRFLHLVLKKL